MQFQTCIFPFHPKNQWIFTEENGLIIQKKLRIIGKL